MAPAQDLSPVFWIFLLAGGLGLLFTLRALRREPFRRVLLLPGTARSWAKRPPASEQGIGVEEALQHMNEIRSRFPFHAYEPPDLDHPANHLDPVRIRRILQGHEGRPGVTCATYVQLARHLLAEDAIPSRTVVGYRSDGSAGHVMFEAAFPDHPGWVLLDPLYVTGFRDRTGGWADAAAVQRWAGHGETLAIQCGSAAAGDPNSQPERLLGALQDGILDRLVAFPPRLRSSRTPPIMEWGWALSGESKPSVWRVQLLQVGVVILVLTIAWLLMALLR